MTHAYRVTGLNSQRTFVPYLGINPSQLTEDALQDLHRRTRVGMEGVLADHGGPALKPINAHILERDAFEAHYRRIAGEEEAAKRDFGRFSSFTYYVMESRALRWEVFYNLGALCREDVPISTIFAHEIMGTVFGSLTEKMLLSDGVEELEPPTPERLAGMNQTSVELSMVSAGWACYVSGIPYSFSDLHQYDIAMGKITMRPELRSALLDSTSSSASVSIDGADFMRALSMHRNRHTFIALALLRIEQMHGFSRVFGYLKDPPGIIRQAGKLKVEGMLRGFWEKYRSAQEMGRLAIPLEYIPASGKMVLDV